MKSYNYIYLCLVTIILFSFMLIIAIAIEKNEYTQERQAVLDALSQKSVVNYFDKEAIETKYPVDGEMVDIDVKMMCVDCDETLATANNRGTVLIDRAPDDVCDTDVARCAIFSYDPFGLQMFNREEIIKDEK